MKKVTAFVGSGHKRLTHDAVRKFLDDLESFGAGSLIRPKPGRPAKEKDRRQTGPERHPVASAELQEQPRRLYMAQRP